MVLTPALSVALPETSGPSLSPHRPAKGRGFRKLAAAFAGAIVIGSFASPAMASPEISTRVVSCGAQSCLLVSGHRDDPASVVSINGQAVSVEGNRGWKVRLTVETVRQWSAPYAREIEVSLRDPQTQSETVASVDLPIGLLGSVTDLASLEVSVR